MAEDDGKKTGEENNNVPRDEWDAINKDIKSAKDSLVSKDTEAKIQAAKEEAKKEAEKEFQTNQKLQELEEQNKKLQEEKENKEKEAAEKISKIQSKVDELISSKAPVNKDDPFSNGEGNDKKGIDQWTDEEVNKLEEEHAKAFFGEEQYNRMLSQR